MFSEVFVRQFNIRYYSSLRHFHCFTNMFQIVRGISQSLNFTVAFYESDDAMEEQWGVKSENGTYTGLIGEMVCFFIWSLGI